MATDEAIFKGSPAAFESAVRTFDRQIGDQYSIPHRAMLIFRTSRPPAAPSAAEVAVVISDRPIAEAASHGGSWAGMSGPPIEAWQWTATVTAHSLPDNRSRLRLRCEDAIWPIVEAHWRMLRAELIRLGYIESAEMPAKPKRGGGRVPERLELRAYLVFKWQEAREDQPGLSGEAFMASWQLDPKNTELLPNIESYVASGSSLYRWQRDPKVQDYIERHYRGSVITQQ